MGDVSSYNWNWHAAGAGSGGNWGDADLSSGDQAVAATNGRRPATCPPGFSASYVVRPGDTMFLIARRFGISLQALIAANPHIPNPALIFPGDVLCVPVVAPPPPGRIPPSCPPGFSATYVVRSGDTMFRIAQRFGISLQALIAANPHITNPNLIFPGDVLCVPVTPPPVLCPPGFQPHIVQAGETFFLLSRRFGITLANLIAANPQIPDPSRIFPGDVVCVPIQPQCPPGSTVVRVQAGDTLFEIAQRFGVSLAALIAANPWIPDPNQLLVGDVICVPPRT